MNCDFIYYDYICIYNNKFITVYKFSFEYNMEY